MEPMEEDDGGIALNSTGRNQLNLSQMSLSSELTPRFIRLHEAVPTLSLYERVRLDTLTALNFFEFQGLHMGSINMHPERHILFKGFRILEKRIEWFTSNGVNSEEDKLEAFLVYLKLGHINLLAGDYARALSAYQRAFKLHEEHFWKDPGAYFGLGVVYLHFKSYGVAIEAFNRHLYTNPTSITASETNARLGVCYKAVKFFPDALRSFKSALNDRIVPSFLTHPQLKYHIALTHDSAGEIDTAYKECMELLGTIGANPGGNYLRAAIERELGWLCYRAVEAEICPTIEERQKKLLEAEQHLQESKMLAPDSGKTHYYLGRCYGEQTPAKAHEAFLNYRASIDKSESDSDTWCSIGVLYHQQNQPMDALQAFMCAVDLDSEHSAAWTNLGNLYEQHFRYGDSLECYRNALKFNPPPTPFPHAASCLSLSSSLHQCASPDAVKARVAVLEKELERSPALLTHQPRPGPFLPPNVRLPPLKDASQQPIPSELRQRQEEFIKVKQQKYRDGSLLWRMGELANARTEPNILDDDYNRPLDHSQLNMLRILKYSEANLDATCRKVLEFLEKRLKLYGCYEGVDLPICKYTVSQLQSQMQSTDALKNFSSLFDVDEDGNPIVKPKEEIKDEADSDVSDDDSVDEEDRCLQMSTELPTTFSLLAPLKAPLDMTAHELLARANKRVMKPSEFEEIFEERVAPPLPPVPPLLKKGEQVARDTPMITVESRKDAQSIELHKFCENSPIVCIRGMTTQLKMDLSVFSTKTLVESFPELEVEVRTQYRQPPDLNVDLLGRPTWECKSERSYTKVAHFSKYQADNFRYSLKDETEKLKNANAKYPLADAAKRRKLDENGISLKQIKFGTNIDMTSDDKFKKQLQELAKMPPFCRVIAGCNLLSHLGHTILGMNTAQIYMKVPGNRTPGHMENNCLASVNINIGPGDCEWFGVPYEYWGAIDTKLRKEGIDFLKGAWWPNADELMQEGIPVYRFTQKAGDVVWVGAGCVHWVQSNGWCNNVAWNVGPITHSQLTMAVHQFEWNKQQSYKSLVPMQHLFWQLAKNVKVTNQKVYSLVRGMLIRSLAYMKYISDWCEKHQLTIRNQPRYKDEYAHYCIFCQVEVYNILFAKEKSPELFEVSCVDCARRGVITEYHLIQQISFEELCEIFNNFQLHMIPKANLVA